MLSILLWLAGSGLAFCGIWIKMQERELAQLKQTLHRYDIPFLERQQESLNTQIRSLQQELRKLDAKAYLQSIDSYEPQYDFISSSDYILRLENIKLKQEEMRKNNQAFICDTEWKLGKGKKATTREGNKMTNDLLNLIEFSFETQCKYAIKEVRYNNATHLKQKINESFNKINKYLKKMDCRISDEYLRLKLIQLDLKYELEDKKQEEREREQEIKKQNKEREVIARDTQRVKEVEDRERTHQQELDTVRQELEKVAQVEVEKRRQLELKVQQLEQQVAEDRRDKEKANRGKSGYIYIISNIGSFRERDLYRICMTNRIKPDEHIREMNPVVPFRFDVHFKIFSEDVFDTLERLYQHFDDKRVNLFNRNREFFKVSMNEIEQALQEIYRETGVLRIEKFNPDPYEYRQTLAIRKKNQHLTPANSYLEDDEIA